MRASPPPLVLLHGSPGSASVFDGLMVHLDRRRRIAPDLPGFGHSTLEVPDYSFRAHAVYVDELLARLAIPRAHVVAFSMGGGVALHLIERDPSRVASLTLVSAIGVQEMELLGQYHLNRVVHAGQLGAMWALIHLVPHGHRFSQGWSYARNFYDSDQRPLRGLLARVQVPTLIVHGRADSLIPIEAAYEHARLVPHAELRVVDADHFMAFEHPGVLAPLVEAFVDRVEAGRAPSRAQASAKRLAAAEAPFDPSIVPPARGVTTGVLAGLLVVGCLALGGWSHIAAGVLVAQGRTGWALAFAAVVGGVLVRSRGRGWWSRMPRHVAWALTGTAVGVIGARLLLPHTAVFGAWQSAAMVTLVLAPAGWFLRSVATYRRRRLLLSSWRRLTEWEYWPTWVVYIPVVVYVAWLMVKHRSITLFTAVNPGIEAGGVVGESKFAILKGLDLSKPHSAAVTLVRAGSSHDERWAHVRRFMADNRLDLPLVVKPDTGQRGSGVLVARSEPQLRAALDRSQVDLVVQEFVPGEEFGVFYYRRPSESRGHILSVTRKRLPTVRGDGRRTLEQLILDDERAVCTARFHLHQQRPSLAEVPPAGQDVSLGDCGSHCRGARFLNGAALNTDALVTAIDEVARAFDGFYFGRFDLRAPSAEAVAAGRDFKVLELNGVTSETTHIYDPDVRFTDAYGALFEQWRLAFEIGAENAARGARTTSIVDLTRLALRYRRDARHHE